MGRGKGGARGFFDLGVAVYQEGGKPAAPLAGFFFVAVVAREERERGFGKWARGKELVVVVMVVCSRRLLSEIVTGANIEHSHAYRGRTDQNLDNVRLQRRQQSTHPVAKLGHSKAIQEVLDSDPDIAYGIAKDPPTALLPLRYCCTLHRRYQTW